MRFLRVFLLLVLIGSVFRGFLGILGRFNRQTFDFQR